MHSYSSALSLLGVSVPPHLVSGAEVPVLDGVQAQGDLLVRPAPAPEGGAWLAVPAEGVQVVRGQDTGNAHWLHAGFDSPGVEWLPAGPPPALDAARADSLVVGHLRVPEGQSALLLHTDEHGANGIGPGEYAIHRKRQSDVTFWTKAALIDD